MNQIRSETRFFVYGALTQGLVHFQKVQDFVLSTEPAQVKGTAYRLKVGFPVVIEAGTDWVPGELLNLNASQLLIELLDQFHGFQSDRLDKSLYLRKEVEVRCESGTLSAWVYFLNPEHLPKTAKLIEKGDWPHSLACDPALTDALSERQKLYIKKLGSVLGREIVPIDLQLYRELMKLEIIVDKGRRLALSKLGHEVFRFLT